MFDCWDISYKQQNEIEILFKRISNISESMGKSFSTGAVTFINKNYLHSPSNLRNNLSDYLNFVKSLRFEDIQKAGDNPWKGFYCLDIEEAKLAKVYFKKFELNVEILELNNNYKDDWYGKNMNKPGMVASIVKRNGFINTVIFILPKIQNEEVAAILKPLHENLENVFDNYLNFGLNLSNFTFILVSGPKKYLPRIYQLPKFPLEKLKELYDLKFPSMPEASIIQNKIFGCLQKIKNPEEKEKRRKEIGKALETIMSTSETDLICTHLTLYRNYAINLLARSIAVDSTKAPLFVYKNNKNLEIALRARCCGIQHRFDYFFTQDMIFPLSDIFGSSPNAADSGPGWIAKKLANSDRNLALIFHDIAIAIGDFENDSMDIQQNFTKILRDKTFFDNFMGFEINLKCVLFIFTVNFERLEELNRDHFLEYFDVLNFDFDDDK